LNDDTTLRDIHYKVQELRLPLAVLDLDNLYMDAYIGEKNYQNIISKFADLGANNSMLITMYTYKQFSCAQFSIYLGFTFENLQTWPKTPFIQKFLDESPDDLYPIIDGKIYEADEKFPS